MDDFLLKIPVTQPATSPIGWRIKQTKLGFNLHTVNLEADSYFSGHYDLSWKEAAKRCCDRIEDHCEYWWQQRPENPKSTKNLFREAEVIAFVCIPRVDGGQMVVQFFSDMVSLLVEESGKSPVFYPWMFFAWYEEGSLVESNPKGRCNNLIAQGFGVKLPVAKG